jgi:Ni,Fe-hydrogenase maturation factor
MRALLIAAGNPLRHDDGAAHCTLELLARLPDTEARSVLQFTPELAQEIAPFESVVFIDADVRATAVTLDPVETEPVTPVLSHASSPAEIVALSRSLFNFAGRAFLCRIPARDVSAGEGLSRRTARFAAQAARLVRLDNLVVMIGAAPAGVHGSAATTRVELCRMRPQHKALSSV